MHFCRRLGPVALCFGTFEGRLTVWFRAFGYGLHFKPAKGHVPLFSERYGFSKCYYLGPLRVMVLKP